MSEGSTTTNNGSRKRLVWGTVLLGLGLGGFFDGIVLHQVLQWHHMLTNIEPVTTIENFELNTLWDGFFHVFTYVSTLIGIALVWSATRLPGFRWSTKLLIGGLLTGWGTFNVVEGVVDHHLLQIHHVMSTGPTLGWDLAFLGWGAVMLVGGLALMRAGDRDIERESATAPAR